MTVLEEAVRARLDSLDREEVARRIWERDHTVWRPEPTEIVDRLGWLTVHRDLRGEIGGLRALAEDCAADGLTSAVLAGMGGSSLAPQVFRTTFGVAEGGLDLAVLDTTHPDEILALEDRVDLGRTLFLVSSKSGTTIETRSHLAHFWERFPDGSRFVAVTDPGTPLAELGEERGFRRVFHADPTIGGRYSALSHFGMVPAALIGADLEALLDGADRMAEDCGPNVPAAENPALRLGALMGEGALAGRDKVTLTMPASAPDLASWLEQLIAESTGKEGKGILPADGGALGPPGVFGDDRLFVAVGEGNGGPILDWLERAGHPVERIPFGGRAGLGGEMFRWELATAVAGHVLGIHPFDQPDVQSAKAATGRILEGGSIPDVDPGDLGELLGSIEPGCYVAIQAFLPRSEETEARLRAVRLRLRDRNRVVVTVGFGPRFLHSTGQLHKGGPPTGRFVQVLEPFAADVPIPGAPYTFGTLLRAQAAGDLEALRARGRRVARVSLDELEAGTSN